MATEFEDEDSTEWIPVSPISKIKTNCPVPPLSTNMILDDDDNAQLKPARTSDSTNLDTANDSCTSSNGSHDELSRLVTPTKKVVAPTTNFPDHSNNANEIRATSQIPPTVHRYRGPLTIGSQVTPRNSISTNSYHRHEGNHEVNGVKIKNRITRTPDKLATTAMKVEPQPKTLQQEISVESIDAMMLPQTCIEPNSSFLLNSMVDQVNLIDDVDVGTNDCTNVDQDDDDDCDEDEDDLNEVVFVGDVNEIPPSDTKLDDMAIIVTKYLSGVSMEHYYDMCWSDNGGAPFYKSWLQNRGNSHVEVADWEHANSGQEFMGLWCRESYTKRRVSSSFI